jgi:hypothetical protein
MVCAKCARLSTNKTTLATSTVTRKSDTLTSSGISYTSKPGRLTSATSAAQGPSGIGKSKLLSASARNPYAAYAASCEKCKVKVQQGHKFCHKCSYKANVCAGCGKKDVGGTKAGEVVQGARFSAK